MPISTTVQGQKLVGLSIETNNAQEMGESPKIAPYTYSVALQGIDACPPMEEIILPSGNYLKFSKRGPMPQTVIELWNEVWDYMRQEDCPFQAAYSVDFEHYTSDDCVDIYVSIKTDSN